MSPLSSDARKPALSVLLRNLALGLDAARQLIELDAFYATEACWQYMEDLEGSSTKLSLAAGEAITRQLEERAR